MVLLGWRALLLPNSDSSLSQQLPSTTVSSLIARIRTAIYTMHVSNTLLLPLILAAFSSALRTGCRDGEVAVGTWQTCTLGSPSSGPSCSDLHATIYANDCGMISYSRKDGDICDVDGGWPSGYGLRCDNNNPSVVYTTGGNFGNCYRKGTNCSPIPFTHYYASWCCSRL
ncbi:hypothetical protein FOXYSP1_08638 [Fusarium oxysporum f. sp. phaseoli]